MSPSCRHWWMRWRANAETAARKHIASRADPLLTLLPRICAAAEPRRWVRHVAPQRSALLLWASSRIVFHTTLRVMMTTALLFSCPSSSLLLLLGRLCAPQRRVRARRALALAPRRCPWLLRRRPFRAAATACPASLCRSSLTHTRPATGRSSRPTPSKPSRCVSEKPRARAPAPGALTLALARLRLRHCAS
jgi:hypothetical protein